VHFPDARPFIPSRPFRNSSPSPLLLRAHKPSLAREEGFDNYSPDKPAMRSAAAINGANPFSAESK